MVKFADTQKDKEQKRMVQQLQQQMQQLSAASIWGNLTGLNSLGPQYLAVSVFFTEAFELSGCDKALRPLCSHCNVTFLVFSVG